MEIYKYRNNTTEWEEIRNSGLKGKERETAFNDYIKRTGQLVTAQEYFNDNDRLRGYYTNIHYQCFGECKNFIDRLVYGEIEYDSQLYYILARDRHPEDLIESRTDWEEMKGYADDLADFIESLKNDIAKGLIIIKEST